MSIQKKHKPAPNRSGEATTRVDSRGFLWHVLHLSRKPVTAAEQYRNRERSNKPRMGVIKPQIATVKRRNRRCQT